jgi:VanZ family protein
MPHPLLAIAAWASAAAVVYATLSPVTIIYSLSKQLFLIVPRRLRRSLQQLTHVVAFTVVGLLMSCCYPRHVILVSGAVITGVALLELLQIFTPDRHAKMNDALWKIAGSVLGVVIGKMIVSFSS